MVQRFCILLCVIFAASFLFGFSVGELNSRPIIGVLTLDVSSNISQAINKTGVSEIPTNYVKYIESGGARVVPILLNRSDVYYQDLFKRVNGILFPGGGVALTTSNYSHAAKLLYDLAVKANDDRDYFPIWGTCLGFEMLVQLIANRSDSLFRDCEVEDVALPLEMASDYYNSRLLRSLPHSLLNTLTTKNVTGNYHKKCLSPPGEKANESLWHNIHILSTNKDSQGSFVSTFEDKIYPFYGVQWHPEKAIFEWTTFENNIPHDSGAIEVSQYVANFFVSEARRNHHSYANTTEEEMALISNYNKENFYFLHNMHTTMRERYIFFNSTQ